MKDGAYTPVREGQTVSLRENPNTLYLYYIPETVTLSFYEDTAGTTLWKTEKVTYEVIFKAGVRVEVEV